LKRLMNSPASQRLDPSMGDEFAFYMNQLASSVNRASISWDSPTGIAQQHTYNLAESPHRVSAFEGSSQCSVAEPAAGAPRWLSLTRTADGCVCSRPFVRQLVVELLSLALAAAEAA
jgi:hypothetical protein